MASNKRSSPATKFAEEPISATTTKQNHQKIVTNMRQVISSTKKKEKSQQRRKKENIRKMEPEITDISTIMTDSLNIVSPNISLEEVKDNKILSPLKEHSTQSDNSQEKKRNVKKSKNADGCKSISNAKSPMKMVSIKDHFSPKPKVDKESESIKIGKDSEQENQSKKLNAFEMMMNARNKSIGSNTPGKEPDKCESDPAAGNSKAITVKRKLMLEEWAEKKGALKRRLDDEEREEYIEYEMKKRAKRLKTMLVNATDKTAAKKDSNLPNKLSLKRKEEKSQSFTERNESMEYEKKSKKKTKKGKVLINKTSTKKRGRRRLSSFDSDESIHIESTGNEDKEFVAKLASPLKKRDSLFGYFPKVTSPTSINLESVSGKKSENRNNKEKSEEKIKSDDGNNSGSKKKIKLNSSETVTPVDNEISKSGEAVLEKTNSGRPKRSCVGKARYDYDLELSPTKLKDVSPKKHNDVDICKKISVKKASIPDIIITESIKEVDAEGVAYVIDLETSMDENYTKHAELPNMNNSARKLAPVFIRAIPKPGPDPELVKARQEFLMSGVPEKMKLEMAKQKQLEQAYEAAVEYFPKISHIFQLDGIEGTHMEDINWEKCKIKWKSDNKSPLSKRSTAKKGKSDNNRRLLENSMRSKLLPLQKLPYIANKRNYVKQIKIKYDKFPTYRCYNQLREKYKSFSAKDADLDTHQLSESFVVTRSSLKRPKSVNQPFNSSQDEDKPPPSAPNGELLFTEKYKPMTSDQVLVNMAPVSALKEFLSSWQIGNNTNIYDPGSELELTTDSTCSSANACNFVVLLGPSSSGKTNAVFALANELNFNVLEVNAGMKRTGKKLLQELHEATQSHQVGKDGVKNNLLKQSLNGFKKGTTDMSDSNSTLDQNNSVKVSLILVEDADIVFEQDAGFVEAIYQLSATSKRPVIITANNPNCQHLIKLMNQHVIHFATPNVLNISKFLSVVSLIENCPIDIDDIVSLYLYNNRNLRKTLLEMQFFIQSGGDRVRQQLSPVKSNRKFFVTSPCRRLSERSENGKYEEGDETCDIKPEEFSKIHTHKTLFEFYATCQNIERHVPFPIDYDILRENLANILNVSEKIKSDPSTKLRVKRISSGKKKGQKCENILGTLTDFYEDISAAVYFTTRDCSEDLYCPSLSDEISHYLVEESLKINLQSDVIVYNLFSENTERLSLVKHIPSNMLRSSRSLALDYESSLRSICRSEKSRSQVERRGSRFYHYLRKTCSNVKSFSTELFDNSCSVLIDAKVVFN